MNISRKGLTIVEVIIIVTVIAILGVIAVISFMGNISETRDSKRISDLESIEKNLVIFKIQTGQYPLPDNGVDVTFNGTTVWTQGTFGENVNRNLWIFWNEFPTDSLYEVEYTYSTTPWWEFQLGWILENYREISYAPIFGISQAQARDAFAYILWDYNGLTTYAKQWPNSYFIATPSIISTDLENTDLIDIIQNQKISFKSFRNLPHTYIWQSQITSGGFNFAVANPVVFTGATSDILTWSGLEDISNNLKSIYAGDPFSGLEKYTNFVNSAGETKVKTMLEKKFKFYFK